MQDALKLHAVVREGGEITVRVPELAPGTEAEVIVLVERPARPRRSMTSFFGSGKGAFASMEEVDAFINQERDQWQERE